MSRGRPPSVFVRRLSPTERRRLRALVRRGCREQVTYRRALVVLQSAQRCPASEIARVLQASPDWVREVICAFNRDGLDALPPRWAGGRPRRITAGMRARIIEVAETRPQLLGEPFASWSLAHLRDYLIRTRVVSEISVERLREILKEEGFSLQRTKSWKRSPDPEFSEKAARVEELYRAAEAGTLEGVVVCFDEHGPCQPIPKGGWDWVRRGWPRRIPANYRKPHGVRFFLGAYDVGADQLWGRWSSSKAAVKILSREEHEHFTLERFEFFIGGIEMGNAFTELNDPLDQEQRFLDAIRMYADESDDAAPRDAVTPAIPAIGSRSLCRTVRHTLGSHSHGRCYEASCAASCATSSATGRSSSTSTRVRTAAPAMISSAADPAMTP